MVKLWTAPYSETRVTVAKRKIPDDELPDLHSLALAHDNHKGLHEVVLEAVVGQLISFQELHGQLAEAVDSIYGNVQILMAAHIHEEV